MPFSSSERPDKCSCGALLASDGTAAPGFADAANGRGPSARHASAMDVRIRTGPRLGFIVLTSRSHQWAPVLDRFLADLIVCRRRGGGAVRPAPRRDHRARRLGQTVVDGEECELEARIDPELVKDVREMPLHRVLAD